MSTLSSNNEIIPMLKRVQFNKLIFKFQSYNFNDCLYITGVNEIKLKRCLYRFQRSNVSTMVQRYVPRHVLDLEDMKELWFDIHVGDSVYKRTIMCIDVWMKSIDEIDFIDFTYIDQYGMIEKMCGLTFAIDAFINARSLNNSHHQIQDSQSM